jgi:UDP:flavonoid glycosyltransferase YjiC (YdhE family)
MQNSLQLYDLAIIPHAEGEEEIFLPEGLERVWAGPILIRDRSEVKSREEARDILGLPKEGRVLYVTFGGGGDEAMDEAMKTTVEVLSKQADLHLAVARAPLYRGRILRAPNVTPVDYYPMAELYPAFDVAISACGYNSATELLHHGVPTAFVPFPRQVDDQDARARKIEEMGAGICLGELSEESLKEAVERLFDREVARSLRERARGCISEGGGDRAAEAIAGLLT